MLWARCVIERYVLCNSYHAASDSDAVTITTRDESRQERATISRRETDTANKVEIRHNSTAPSVQYRCHSTMME